jgi:hypothetical protein
MPSHTFTRVGSWQESIDTNIASAATAMRDGTFAEALHAMDCQVYAYLQTGQDAAARRVLQEAPGVLARLDVNRMGGAASPVGGYYASAAIPARYALERGAWAEAAALDVRTTPVPYVNAITHFARAIGALRTGNTDAALADVAALEALAAKQAATNDAYWTGQVQIQLAIARAWLEFAQGSQAEAVEKLRATADAEDATDKAAVSPGPLAPARELFAEMLLAMKRPADALVEFEKVMQKEPNRFRTTYLAARAAELAGDAAKARRYRAQLTEIAKAGDKPGRPELEEARSKR